MMLRLIYQSYLLFISAMLTQNKTLYIHLPFSQLLQIKVVWSYFIYFHNSCIMKTFLFSFPFEELGFDSNTVQGYS